MIAHRGGVLGTNIEENSIESFSRAMLMPLDYVKGIEFDLRRTNDNVCIIAHDPTLYMKDVNKEKYICDLNFSQIRQEYPNICTFYELLDLALSSNYKGELNIEIKDYDISEDICSIITNIKYRHLHFFITSFLHSEVQSFYERITEEYENYNSPKMGYLFSSYPYNMKNILSDLPNTLFIVLNDKTLPRNHDHPLMQLLIKHSHRIYIYTVNNKDETDYYLKCGFHVITDNLIN